MPRTNTKSDSYEALCWDVITNAHRYLTKPGDRVLDLGAHFGMFALHCAARGCLVDAYEPAEEAFAELQHSAAVAKEIGLGVISCYRYAIWSSVGYRSMSFSKDSTAANSLIPRLTDTGFTSVRTVDLHSALRGETWDCVKMDVEGAEAEIFSVVDHADFARIKFLTIEIHNDILDLEVRRALVSQLQSAFPHNEVIPVKVNGEPARDVATLLCWR